MSTSPEMPMVRIVSVIVIYRMVPNESRALQSLQQAASQLPCGCLDLKIILYDNTPGGQVPRGIPPGLEYKSDPENGGLAPAYNYALNVAHTGRFEWLLTLDQDTELPVDFLLKLCPAMVFANSLECVGAVAPQISVANCNTSPWVRRPFRLRPTRFPSEFIGVPAEAVYAANSASAFKVAALRKVGGYDADFPLWSSDLVIFHRLYRCGFKVLVAGHIQVEHEVSVLDLEKRSTPSRYEEMLRAEEAFYDQCMGRCGHLVLISILLHRVSYKLWTTHGNLQYFLVAFRFLLRSVFRSRSWRMKDWKHSILQRNQPNVTCIHSDPPLQSN